MIKNYFILTWRNLKRNKIYSFINITGLSIGLACCMLILLYNRDEVSFDRFHKNAENIFRVTATSYDEQGKIENYNAVTGMLPGPSFKRSVPEVKDFVRVSAIDFPVKVGTEIFDQSAIYVDDNFFNVFSFPLKSGNRKTVLNDMFSVVLSEEVAKKFFGAADAAMGKVIQLPTGADDHGIGGAYENFTVTGIVPKSPQNSSLKLQMLIPIKLNMREGRIDDQWINFYLNTFVVLHAGADVKKVADKFQQVYEKESAVQVKEVKEKYGMKSTFKYGLQPLLDIHLNTQFSAMNGLEDGSNPVYTKILGGIAIFMLLIACINFVNLTVARSLKRAKEIGVRKVVGGERKQLIAQFLGESFVLSFFAFTLAIVLVNLALPLFNELSNKALAFSYLLDAKLIAGYITLFIVTSLLAGFYPTMVLSGFNPVQTLYNRMPLSGKNYLSKSLVVLQFTLTTFLIIATIVIYSQFNFLTHFDLGYNDKNMVLVATDQMKAAKVAVFRNELMKNNNITSVAVKNRGSWGKSARVDGNDIDFAIQIVDSAYFPTMQIPIIKGRNFSALYPSDSTRSVLVNEAFVKRAGWKDIAGKQVDFFYDSIKYNVVGVVKDYHYTSLMEEIKPELFIMNPKYNYGLLMMKIKPENTSATLRHIEKVFKAQMPCIPFQYDFKDENNSRQYAAEAKWKQIITAASLLTIFISCIGLFGLATLAAEKRTKEVGIRKVLGASVTNIAVKLSNSFVKLVLLAALLAFPAAWFVMNKWLQNYPYRVSINAWTFIIALVVVSAVALFTVSFQAIKAARSNPVKSLRTE